MNCSISERLVSMVGVTTAHAYGAGKPASKSSFGSDFGLRHRPTSQWTKLTLTVKDNTTMIGRSSATVVTSGGRNRTIHPVIAAVIVTILPRYHHAIRRWNQAGSAKVQRRLRFNDATRVTRPSSTR